MFDLFSDNSTNLGRDYINRSEYQSSEPNDKNKVWLEKVFRTYYFNFYSNVELDEFIHEHEFGFRLFDGKIHRHLAFKNKRELYAYIIKFSPSDIFYSSSRYERPTAPIDQKGWLGSDLIFDIDGKDLKLECSLVHNLVLCRNCKQLTKGINSKCITCNSSQLQMIDLPCNKCIKSLKEEVKKLKEILVEDFGIDEHQIFTYFSGNNGFHIHVKNEEYYKSSSRKRNAFTQYLMGKGYMIENLGLRKNNKDKIIPISNKILYDRGWRRRILNQLKLQIQNHKIDNRFVKKFIQRYSLKDNDFLLLVHKQVEDLSVRIDSNVTMDIHRIFRLAGSINSKSGLTKTFCKNIEAFNPTLDACFLGESKIEIDSKLDIMVSLKGKQFNIKTGSNFVPEYVAVYIVSKGIGSII